MTSLVTSSDNERFALLISWAAHVLRSSSPLNVEPLNGDASFRRYYRFAPSGPIATQYPSLLVVDAPPATENSLQFIAIGQTLARQGIRTPAILFADTDNGFLIIEDFGDNLFGKTAKDNPQQYYSKALTTLAHLQQAEPAQALIPPYDQELLLRELQIFDEWFVGKYLEETLDSAQRQLLDEAYQRLIASALEQPSTWVHRDFHSRNLLWCKNGDLGVIDFQGALLGPITYDLASLLKDCYLQLPEDSVTHLALAHKQQLVTQGSLDEQITDPTFLRWFDWMGLQRHIKVLGIFARLVLRDNKPHYLADIPLVLEYTLSTLKKYPEFIALATWFDAILVPAFNRKVADFESPL